MAARTPLNPTPVTSVKLIPSSVTRVTPGFPNSGKKFVMTGTRVIRNGWLHTPVPPGFTTLTRPIIGVAGTVALICEADDTGKRRRLVAECHPGRADEIRAQDLDYRPGAATSCEKPSTNGARPMTRKSLVLIAMPAGEPTRIGPTSPLVAADGTVAVTCMAELT